MPKSDRDKIREEIGPRDNPNGMISAFGEYTPDGVWDLLDTCDELESEHRAALEPGPCGKPGHLMMHLSPWEAVPENECITDEQAEARRHCTLCAEVRAAEESMRQKAVAECHKFEQFTRVPTPDNGVTGGQRYRNQWDIEKAILALPLSSEVKVDDSK